MTPVVRAIAGFAGLAAIVLQSSVAAQPADRAPLPGTRPLEMEGDIASELVSGVDRFLLREIAASEANRAAHWRRDTSSAKAYNESIAPNRERLAHITGVRDARVPFDGPELTGTTAEPSLVGQGAGYTVYAVRWPTMRDVHGEGLLLVPDGREPVASVIAIPDADTLPEHIVGLVEGVPRASQFARRLGESGCRVLVPTLVDRSRGKFVWGHGKRPRVTAREFLYRSAFELGRGLVGYEIQKILALVDWLDKAHGTTPIGVMGWGEGGLLALHAAALDPRIDAACVSGYFDRRDNVWQEPIDRNVFGLLEQFGDAELAGMIAPRTLVVEAAAAPAVDYGGEGGGAPARIATPALDALQAEIDRAGRLTAGLTPRPRIELVVSGNGDGAYGTATALEALLKSLAPDSALAPDGAAPAHLRRKFDPDARLERTMVEIDRHNQWLLRESPWVRKRFVLDELDTSSEEAYRKSSEPLRRFFHEEVIGRFQNEVLPPDPRTRKVDEAETHVTYEVVLDVYPDVVAYGLLLLPRDIPVGQRRPSSCASTVSRDGRRARSARRTSGTTTCSRRASRSGGSSRSRRRTSTYSGTASAHCSARPTRSRRRSSR